MHVKRNIHLRQNDILKFTPSSGNRKLQNVRFKSLIGR